MRRQRRPKPSPLHRRKAYRFIFATSVQDCWKGWPCAQASALNRGFGVRQGTRASALRRVFSARSAALKGKGLKDAAARITWAAAQSSKSQAALHAACAGGDILTHTGDRIAGGQRKSCADQQDKTAHDESPWRFLGNGAAPGTDLQNAIPRTTRFPAGSQASRHRSAAGRPEISTAGHGRCGRRG